MSLRFEFSALTGTLLLSLTALGTSATPSSELDERAQALNKKILNLDAHTDVLLESTPERYWGPGHSSRTDVEKLTRGSIDAVALSISVGPGPRTPEGVAEARKEADAKLATIRRFVADNSARVEIARSAADIERINRAGRIAVLETFLNARSLGKDVKQIDAFYQAGVRVFGLTHAGNNDFADSSRPQEGEGQEHRGLSPLGRQAIARLNSLGIIIDVSQLTPDGVSQVLAITKAPVIASHSNARALIDNPRNLSDKELDAIKANGGLVAATPFNAYLAKLPADFDAKVRALRQQHGLKPEHPAFAYTDGADTLPKDKEEAFLRAYQASYPKATLTDYVDHIDYLVKLMGIDHVGIGTDFNHGSGVEGFRDESEAVNVTRELLKRGYTEEQIAKIWGGNFLRVFRDVEAAAKKLRST